MTTIEQRLAALEAEVKTLKAALESVGIEPINEDTLNSHYFYYNHDEAVWFWDESYTIELKQRDGLFYTADENLPIRSINELRTYVKAKGYEL